ncbi:acetylcholinesterase-like [Dreissena polymorpha]|uniref:Carboxylesterase type B domain-containing protein n=1 Tax=Dreissena polymorpha TaxID=45954 RepID=A0A9D4QRZ5_DREPO|nr:acetylcholinesterase-like [Dreissena polymorpha]KAH3841426.1 hypothetical protein DPMN_114889 [Dreissena polymorpha]
MTVYVNRMHNLFALSLIYSVSAASNVVVQTLNGKVRGYVLDIAGHNAVGTDVDELHVFLGVPYAEPPTGSLRFAYPVPRKPWAPTTLDALRPAPACPQRNWFLRTYSFDSNYDNFNEDCLYLNIFVPQRHSNPNASYPILFFVHGGSYQYGSGNEYDGRILAQEGIVVVTVNYRVGALGFLSTDDDVVPGNYGLLDQLTALKWVKNNIDRFHGDPSRITVDGQSAGGSGVSLHMFSPLAKDLFSGLIPQSGCALSPFAVYRPPTSPATAARALAAAVGCPTTNSTQLIACLRTKDALVLANTRISGPPMIAAFAPRVDGFYLKELPEVLLAKRDYLRHVNVMTGYVPQVVSEDLEDIEGIDQGLTATHLRNLFRDKSDRYQGQTSNDVYHALLCAYPPSNDVRRNRDYAVDMNSDYGYVVPHVKLAQALSTNGERVWLYDFTYRSPNTSKLDWIGVPHAEELYYQFGAPFFDSSPCPGVRDVTCPSTWGTYQTWSDGDRQVSQTTMRMWADFVRMSNTSTSFLSTGPDRGTWRQFEPGHNVLNISGATVHAAPLRLSPGQRFWQSFNFLNLTADVTDVCGSQSSILVGK